MTTKGKNEKDFPIFEDVIVEDPKKCEEILSQLLKRPNRSIAPKQPPKLPENAEDIWFKRR